MLYWEDSGANNQAIANLEHNIISRVGMESNNFLKSRHHKSLLLENLDP